MKRQVAIFGLAANPIHLGHIAIAQEVSKHFNEVWISPCYAHKFNKELIDDSYRLEMCILATCGIKKLNLSTREIEAKWTGNTYDWLQNLKAINESLLYKVGDEYSFIIGQDNADSIDKWSNYEKLIAEYRFVVLPREAGESQTQANWYLNPPHLFLKDAKIPHISSTMIRDGFKTDPESVREFLHPNVFKFIQKHSLYR